MASNREWMYTKRLFRNGAFNEEFRLYVFDFLEFAYTNPTNIQHTNVEGVEVLEIRCPCRICENLHYKPRNLVELHLCHKGFMKDYSLWYAHGELYQPQEIGQCSNPQATEDNDDNDDNAGDYPRYQQMIIESMHQPEASYYQQAPQHPNQSAQTFFKMLNQVSEPLWEGSKKASTLSTTTRLLNWKSQFNASDSSFDGILSIIKDSLPPGEKLPNSFYETKKMLKPLQLPSQRIHVCKNHCMLFFGYHSDLDHCAVCNESRYKERGNKVPNLVMTYMPIGPRLQRLFYSKKTAQHLTWHSDHLVDHDKMIHPSEGRAWKHLDEVFPDFAQETRNVRLGLCTDGFNPNSSSGSPYSCWPVFITVYNLPPWLAFKHQYILLPLIFPGPKSPGQNLDVFLQPLVHELKMLFTDGIETYDAHRRDNFQMRAVLLWTISDFPTYAMLSGWRKELTGKEPPYMDVFCKVNLTSKSKKKYFEGDQEDPLDFATGTAREVAEAYNRGLFEKYGEDPAQHMVNNPELWTQTQLHRQGGKQKGPMYGIGSSDLNYVVTGTYSSESSSNSVAAADYAKSQADYAKSQADYAKSQEKVNELEQQLVNMQQSMDESQNAITLEMEQMKKTREELAAFMKEFRPPGNPPP